jgi:hypothetical protein
MLLLLLLIVPGLLLPGLGLGLLLLLPQGLELD